MPLTGMLQVFGLRLMAKAALVAGRHEAALTPTARPVNCLLLPARHASLLAEMLAIP